MKTLTLTLRTGPAAGTARMTDGSRSFTIGTEPGCTWPLPPGEGAGGCVAIRRSGDGFVMEVAGVVAMEGRPLHDGAEVPLHHGGEIAIGAHALSAHVSQAGEAPASGGPTDAFHEAGMPTISGILSDVTPGGDAASGPLPGRTGEEWLDSFRAPGGKAARPDWDSLGAYGEAEAAGDPLDAAAPGDPLRAAGKLLPDDWDAPASDVGNRIAQAPSDRLSVQLGNAPREAPAPRGAADARVLREAAGLYEGEVDAADAVQLANAGAALRTALAGLAEVERAVDRALGDLDLPPRPAGPLDHATLDPGAILSDATGEAVLALDRRIDAVTARQAALLEEVLASLAAARDAFDPDTLRAAVAARGGAAARLAPARAAWAEHVRRWSDEAAPLRPGTLRTALARRIDEATGGADT